MRPKKKKKKMEFPHRREKAKAGYAARCKQKAKVYTRV